MQSYVVWLSAYRKTIYVHRCINEKFLVDSGNLGVVFRYANSDIKTRKGSLHADIRSFRRVLTAVRKTCVVIVTLTVSFLSRNAMRIYCISQFSDYLRTTCFTPA